ncbi:hypothetical protein ACFFSY_10800 [Paenibacillus aurantiacus]|uniref:Uncharacterized protein n=1 Tax=Paenibacillus aurantiacus TaxID=1936118 RepID=A0ABV5KQA8_9BACL
MKPLVKPKLWSVLVGGVCSVLWVFIGVILYMNSLASLSGFGMTYLVPFLWGVPALLVLGAIFSKNANLKSILPLFLAGTVTITFLLPVLLE